MSPLGRRALVACLLTLYVSVSVCGVSLHTMLERTLSHHDHGPAPGSGATISGVSHDCLLCEFYAQGQLPVEVPRPVSRPLGAFRVSLSATFPETPERYASCHPRAPPSARETIV
jgi:hypothetical protein